MAFIYKMHWSRWNGKTAVATAVYYDRRLAPGRPASRTLLRQASSIV
jgi:hypothetical protein